MDSHVRGIILNATGADDLFEGGSIQSLWSGYGSIDRYGLIGSELNTVVVKHVRLPDQSRHPRGWNTDRSHQRKLHSYQVETAWYEHWAARCDDHCRIPHCLALEHHDDEVLMVLEDLDGSGFPARKGSVTEAEMIRCLSWLAHFHATFMDEKPEGLWDIGTYWHLDTRPDELATMEEGELKQAAEVLDRTLNEAPLPNLCAWRCQAGQFLFLAGRNPGRGSGLSIRGRRLWHEGRGLFHRQLPQRRRMRTLGGTPAQRLLRCPETGPGSAPPPDRCCSCGSGLAALV